MKRVISNYNIPILGLMADLGLNVNDSEGRRRKNDNERTKALAKPSSDSLAGSTKPLYSEYTNLVLPVHGLCTSSTWALYSCRSTRKPSHVNCYDTIKNPTFRYCVLLIFCLILHPEQQLGIFRRRQKD